MPKSYASGSNENNNGDDDGDDVRDFATEMRIQYAYSLAARLDNKPLRCDDLNRRRLRRSLQRDEARLLRLATGERLKESTTPP